MPPYVAIVDDNIEMTSMVQDLLENAGYKTKKFSSAIQALSAFKEELPHILITDNKMKEIDGLMFLKRMKAEHPSVTCIMMTAFGSIETAIKAVKLGAFHYIVKPFNNQELLLLVKRALDNICLKKENKSLRETLDKKYTLDSIIGKSPVMQNLFDRIRMVSNCSANVLISGESGTGKELVARALHNCGKRKDGPFVAINCTAIPENLLESELFGHVKGAFTGAHCNKKGLFEEANGGSLFLDEIGDLSHSLQAKLLRVIQERKVRPVGGSEMKEIDVRLIAATHKNLRDMIKKECFREDLFYRLNVVPLQVPALRERLQDIPLLVERFIEKFSLSNNSSCKKIDKDALQTLMQFQWPGNVRELENTIERAVVLSKDDTIRKSDILESSLSEPEPPSEELKLSKSHPTLEELEKTYIRQILEETDYKKEEAASILGISRRTLYRKEHMYGWADEPHSKNAYRKEDAIRNG